MGKLDSYSRIKELVKLLNNYTKLYDEGRPAITDKEWDNLYFELVNLERDYPQWILPESPTQKIDYQVVNGLNKVKHSHPMLSLAKTKSVEELIDFIDKKPSAGAVIMLKLDGLTCSLTYEGGRLVRAETRGNGEVGEDVTHNALVVKTIPKRINYLEKLTVDGEIICLKEDFAPFSEEYANPRNFAAGSIRLLDSSECAKRNLTFVAWDCIEKVGDTLVEKLAFLRTLGFVDVPWTTISGSDKIIEDNMDYLTSVFCDYPIDGFVIKYDNVDYYNSLGNTAHHFNGGIAFKMYDEMYYTSLRDIQYDVSRLGVLTPVAVFDEVEIEGSIVSRASLSNLSIMEETLGPHPYIGQLIAVSKRNQVIPKVEWADKTNLEKTKKIHIPSVCPVCGKPVEKINDGLLLFCPNPQCDRKLINQLDHIFGRKALDIRGLSKQTFEKLIDWGWINRPADVFELEKHKNNWYDKTGFGKKSVDNILAAIEKGRHQTLEKFIVAIGIPGIGTTQAKEICKVASSYGEFRQCSKADFLKIDGFGPQRAGAIETFNYTDADEMVKYLIFEKNNDKIIVENEKKADGKTFVVTGSLNHWPNRDALKSYIEEIGGKVVGSVSKNTNYLINNDINSSSSKNRRAKELNIPILNEEDFLQKFS